MSVVNFPTVGAAMDTFIKRVWVEINALPDDTSVSSIIGALHIVAFDLTERMVKKDTP